MRPRNLLRGFYVLVLIMRVFPSGTPLHAGEKGPLVREELIAELGADVPNDAWELIATSDGSQVAWREKRGSKYVAVLNGKASAAQYDEVSGLRFSEDGKRFAFSARRGKEWAAVVDGVEQAGSFQKVSGVVFSSDSSRTDFIAKAGRGLLHVVNGKIGNTYKDVTAAEFSADSRHIVYAAQKGKQWLVVEDGVEGPFFDDVGRPRYQPKGQRLVYIARRGKSDVLIEAGKERPLPEAKDGYRLAGFAVESDEPLLEKWDGETSRMLIGNSEGPLGQVRLRPILCTEGCRHSVYATAYIKNPTFGLEHAYGQIVVDGKPGRMYEGASPESAVKALFRAMGGSELRIQPGTFTEFLPRSYGVSTPAVTPDLQHVAYAARRGNRLFSWSPTVWKGRKWTRFPATPNIVPTASSTMPE